MILFEAKYKSYINRLVYWRNLIYPIVLIFYSYLVYIFTPLHNYRYIIIFFLSIILLAIYYKKTKNIIYKIKFDTNGLLHFEGESLCKEWNKTINVNQTKISIISEGSKKGICGAIFFLKFKSNKESYIVNYFENFSYTDLIKIFELFKNLKNEKIILDEKLVINRIQEKIDKCQ